MDAFEVLGLDRAWRLSDSTIRNTQRQLSTRWHPDRCLDPAQRTQAIERMGAVNEAAAILLDPLARGQELLNLFRPDSHATDPRPEQGFLAEMMEIREAIDQHGGRTDPEIVQRLLQLSQSAQHDADYSFTALLQGDSSAWMASAEALGRLRALRRANEDAKA